MTIARPPTRRLRIAHIGLKGLPGQAGAERVADALVRRTAIDHDVTVYCSVRYTPAGTRFPGVRLVRVPALAGKHSHMLSADLFAALHAVIGGGYDVIHVHNVETCFTLPLLRLRYPVVATAHGRVTPGSKWGGLASRIMAAMEWPFGWLANARTSVSDEDARALAARLHRAVEYVPNGVDVDVAPDLEAARRMLAANGVEAGSYAFFAAGRILPLKGAHLAVEAFRAAGWPERLVIAGDLTHAPEYARELRAMTDQRVVFLPFVTSLPTLLGLVALSRLFIFPSTAEGMSMMLLEAAATGVPVVASDIPANQAVLPDQARYFRSGDAESLADQLRWSREHPDELRMLGERARAWCRQEFAWGSVAERYDAIYRRVAGESAGRVMTTSSPR